MRTLRQPPVCHFPFTIKISFHPSSASSKSEGSPLQRPENAGKKPDDRRELVRPSRPAVRASDE